MWTKAQLLAAFSDEAGDAAGAASSADIVRWFNDAQEGLGYYKPTTSTLSWTEGDANVALPTDFFQLVRLYPPDGSCLPRSYIFGTTLVFDYTDGAPETLAAVQLHYLAIPAAVGDAQASTLPAPLDLGALSYALSRFYRKLASSRSMYQRYVTLAGETPMETGDLISLAQMHMETYGAAAEKVPALPAAYFYKG